MTRGVSDTNSPMEVTLHNPAAPRPPARTKEQNGSSAPESLPTYSHLHVSWRLLHVLHGGPSGRGVHGEAALLQQLLWAADTTLRYH